jgi:hypothetical protein
VRPSRRAVYGAVAAGILAAELAIAAGVVAGPFIRGSMGDVLAVALIYFSLRAFPGLRPATAAVVAVTTGFAVEGLQWLRVADVLGFEAGGVLHTLVGNTFSVADLTMYVAGGAAAFAVDRSVLIPRLQSVTPEVVSESA